MSSDRTDTDRMDWLNDNMPDIEDIGILPSRMPTPYVICLAPDARFEGATWREAVDGAMDAREAYQAAAQDRMEEAHRFAQGQAGSDEGKKP